MDFVILELWKWCSIYLMFKEEVNLIMLCYIYPYIHKDLFGLEGIV